MKRTPTRFALAALIGVALFPPFVVAQDEVERFVIQARDANVVSNDELRMVAVGVGAVDGPYQSVERPQVGANLIGTELTIAEAMELRNSRPDLLIERAREVFRNSNLPGGGVPPIPWSPDRIDQRVGNDAIYLPAYLEACDEYRPYIYVCDTGVFSGHDDFTMASPRVNFAGSYIPALLPRTIPAFQDPYDHGTAVAACAVGEQTGAGRGPASVVSAVCYPDPGAGNGGGTFASFAADVIYWSLNEHLLRGLDNDLYNDASVLIFASSTANGPSAILDLAVERARLGGMMVVVSAGNNNADAVTTSPAGAAGVGGDITLTVAASTVADVRWPMSNYGLVELFAPGDNVLCASSTGPNICTMRNGTSFSAGYVAGAAARILSRYPWATPNQVCNILTNINDPVYGPSGPFGAGVNGVPKLLYVNPISDPKVTMTYGEWTQFHFLSPPEPEADAEGDGVLNLMEYFMGLDPNKCDPPENRPEFLVNGDQIEFRFRRANYLVNPTNFEVQISSDFVNWTPLPPEWSVEDVGVPCDIVATQMVTKIPAGGSARIYVRLVLSGP